MRPAESLRTMSVDETAAQPASGLVIFSRIVFTEKPLERGMIQIVAVCAEPEYRGYTFAGVLMFVTAAIMLHPTSRKVGRGYLGWLPLRRDSQLLRASMSLPCGRQLKDDFPKNKRPKYRSPKAKR